MRSRSTGRKGPVTPIELAEAAVLADLALGLVVVGWLLPLGAALFAAACVPLVVLGVRQRPRVLFVGVAAAAALGFLVGGTGIVTNLAGCTAISGMVAIGIRRRWGPVRAGLASVVFLWPPIALLTDALLVVFGNLRRLSLDQLENFWNALHHFFVRVHLAGVARSGDRAVHFGLDHWWLLVPAAELLLIAGVSLVVYGIALRVVGRLAEGPPRVTLGDGGTDDRPPAPVPVALEAVAFRYPGAATDALHDVTAEIPAHRYVAVTGPNGAGKSTLVRLLAGAPPAAGAIHRPGAVGLGRPGGTAIVFQRPESQVLGVRVRDDVVWGLPAGALGDAPPAVDALLELVGLGGFGDRDTDGLSGGQLQRLAIAAALARRPALLVSDESTAMLDPAGRDRLLALLRDLPGSDGPTVVHATHRAREIAAADAVVQLGPARLPIHPLIALPPRPAGRADALAQLTGVGYVYSDGTPWAHRALRAVDLTIGAADAMLVVGGNGSGKTTLAWLLAGLLTPTEGSATLDGNPIVDQVGRVGLGFQHARLQLLHHSVAGELDVDGRGAGAVVDALAQVGLPADLRTRAIDDLSGGQQRRVALARLLLGDSPLLVLDEPLAGLDDEARAELVSVLTRLRASRPIGLVIVSHDLEELAPVVDRVVALRSGEIVMSERADAVDTVSAFLAAEDAQMATRTRRRDSELRPLRYLPGDSAVHRIWAGTKIVTVGVVSLALSLRPSWRAIALAGGLVVVTIAVARIPRGAVPRIPSWVWMVLVLGGAIDIMWGPAPHRHVLGATISTTAADQWTRLLLVGVELLALAAVVAWTTRLGDLAPAMRRLLRPARALRLPVDEVVVAVALCVRCFPLLAEELRVLLAARRLRPELRDPGFRAAMREPVDLLVAATSVCLRRSRELADAIEARGGVGVVSEDESRPHGLDVAVIVAVVGLVAFVFVP